MHLVTITSPHLSLPLARTHPSSTKVVNVTSPDASGTYAPGDVVTVWVTFDHHVVVVGEPLLNLNTGTGEPGVASYAGGSGNQASKIVKAAQSQLRSAGGRWSLLFVLLSVLLYQVGI